jgi:hypothetical protein
MENTDKVRYVNDRAEWFIAVGEDWIGPLRVREIHEKIEKQELSWLHYAWKKGLAGWTRVCDLDVFQDSQPQKPSQAALSDLEKGEKPKLKKVATQSKKSWFVYYNESQYGPFSVEEIQRYLATGRMTPRVFGWTQGMEKWERLERIEAFSSSVKQESLPKESAKEQKEQEKEEQRQAPRRPVVARIIFTNQEEVILGVCRDISIGGMQVLTDRIPGPMGTKIRLNVSASGPRVIESFVAEGLIVRILEDGRGFSFRFNELSADSRAKIEEYLRQYDR